MNRESAYRARPLVRLRLLHEKTPLVPAPWDGVRIALATIAGYFYVTASVVLNASAGRRAFKIAQDRPLSIRNRHVIRTVDVFAFLEAEDRLDDARCVSAPG